jgi:hypothetical protein
MIEIYIIPVEFSNFRKYYNTSIGVCAQTKVMDYLLGKFDGDGVNQCYHGYYAFLGFLAKCSKTYCEHEQSEDDRYSINEIYTSKAVKGTMDDVNLDISELDWEQITKVIEFKPEYVLKFVKEEHQ